MRSWRKVAVLAAIGVFAAGCPKDKQDYKAARHAVDIQDYDAAVEYYLKATKADPHNVDYKIGLDQARFEAGQNHVKQGLKLREKGDLQGAVSEFQRAQVLDPSSTAADQELKRTLQLIAERAQATQIEDQPLMENGEPGLASAPPELKPLSRAPINLRMSNDVKVVYDTIGKLAGLTVIYDPDVQARRIPVELNNVTLEQALDIVSLESKAFWKPVTENIILIAPDNTSKRRDYEEQVVRTFYLSNIAIPQDLTEITTGLRTLLDLKRISQVNAQNAIVIRDTPDKVALAEKIIRDIDKAKPEVVIQMEVLQARTDKLRNLGILPGQSASIAISPNTSTTTSTSSTSSTTSTSSTSSTSATPGTFQLNQLTHLNQSDVILTLPGATANFVLTDSATKIIDNPEIRAIDGQPAKLRVGDRVPVATGSFQAGVGVGSTAGAGFVNPLVNTQFQYIDVGVNVDITPHVHPNRDISMKVSVEVSSVTSEQTIGGIQQPVISQKKIEQEIRLKEGEVSILGGLFERIDTRTLNGWPGLANVPIMRYLFSADQKEIQEQENLIVLIPRIVRMPDWTRANLRALYSGTETNPAVKREMDIKTPAGNATPTATPASTAPVAPATAAPANPLAAPENPANAPQAQVSGPRIRFEPAALNLTPGQTATIGVVVENVTDLFSVPMLLQYNPAVISVEEVRHGGFLSGGTQEIALVQRVDKEHGQAIISATRQPNTPGVNGTGTLLGVVVKALAPGSTTLSIVQVNAKDSQQKPIPLVTSEATLRVQ